MQGTSRALTRLAYDRTAPFYDALTAHHDYERWLPRLVVVGRRYGLRGNRLLDVGCGTGKSFLPLLRAGWEVTACDLSPAMLRRAKSKSGGRARLELADMRSLPRYGAFDLVWSIDDAVNYLLEPGELESCLRGMARNVAPAGRVMFDVNTLRTYRTFFATTEVRERRGRRLIWRGHGNAETGPGSRVAATFDVVPLGGSRRAAPIRAVHRQRHFRPEEVLEAMEQAGLDPVAVLGQGLDGHLEQPLDEERHTKAVFVGKGNERR